MIEFLLFLLGLLIILGGVMKVVDFFKRIR